MRAVELRAVGAGLVVTDRPWPTATDGGTVIDVTACGVCHSDVHVVDGVYPSPLPLVLGHEVTGVHPELGPVIVYAPWGCGRCRFCLAGEEMLCPDGREAGIFADGGYAEAMAVPDPRYLHPLDGLDPVTSAPLACGGLTAFRAVKHTLPTLRAAGAGPRAPSRVIVLGAGGLGQFAIQYLRLLTDAEVVVGDPSPAKQARALELGARMAADPGDLNDADAGTATVVLDFAGADQSLAAAARLVARQGLVVVVGLYGGRIPFGLGAVPHEARFMSSIWGSPAELDELLALARRERIEHTVEVMALADAEQAHQRLRRGEVAGRVVLVPQPQGVA